MNIFKRKDKKQNARPTINQLNQWHEDDENEKIIQAIEGVPRTETTFDLRGILARAYNNISEYDKALQLLLADEDQGKNDAVWNYRTGYAYLHQEQPETALAYLQKSKDLGAEYTEELIEQCGKFMSGRNSAKPAASYTDFWSWFSQHAEKFHAVVKTKEANLVEKEFLDVISPKLKTVDENFWFLTGMYTDDIVELCITPDGRVETFVFAEEIINVAPALEGWKFTALKPPAHAEGFDLQMNGYSFDKKVMSFHPVEHPDYPDLVHIAVAHSQYKEENKEQIATGVFLYLDNMLGELKSMTSIDLIDIISPEQVQQELIPIEKINDYLTWRETEFVEKYNSVYSNVDPNNYSVMQASLQNGYPLLATVNTALLAWDAKPSHPWALVIIIDYIGNRNGFPIEKSYLLMDEFEDEIMGRLNSNDGFLNVARETADGTRKIFIYCNEYRQSSKVVHETILKYAGRLNARYEMYRDKYWQTIEKFKPQQEN